MNPDWHSGKPSAISHSILAVSVAVGLFVGCVSTPTTQSGAAQDPVTLPTGLEKHPCLLERKSEGLGSSGIIHCPAIEIRFESPTGNRTRAVRFRARP
jgi:hypothetical protein